MYPVQFGLPSGFIDDRRDFDTGKHFTFREYMLKKNSHKGEKRTSISVHSQYILCCRFSIGFFHFLS